MASFHTIVAAVDFSDISGEVLETARDMARLHHARLHVIHAVGDPFRSMLAVESTGLDLPAVVRQWTEAAQERLATLVEEHPIEPALLTTAVLSGLAGERHRQVRRGTAGGPDCDRLSRPGRGQSPVARQRRRTVLHLAGRPVFVVAHRDRHLTSFEVKAAAGVGA